MLGALKRRWRTTRRSVSADNQYEAEREGLSEIIASPRYLEFLKNYREEAAATAASDATLAVSSPRYIEVRKGRIVLESSQQQPPPLPIRNGAQPPDGEKTDLQHQQQQQQHQLHHGRDSVLRINREKVPAGCPMVASTTFPDVGVEHEISTPFPPLPPSPPSSPTARQGYSPNASSPVHECGKLVRNTSGSVSDSCKNTELLEARIAELEEALLKLQERVNQSQCNSPTLEKEIKEHLEVMSKAMKTKDRKSMQVCREHKTLQVRFQKQENSLMALQNENKSLHQRVRQYETCLDDIMRKVVDALVAEDSLRDEVAILKSRVRDLEAQNAALVTTTHASPAKSRDEGYCTMSSGQPQPPTEGHLEELPEEPEQWLMSAEPCTADMEDWSMSQEELATALDEENHEWIWNSSFLTTAETQTEDITALLHDQIVYSEDEEVACTNFTRDFYRLVSFTSGSTRSLHSPVAAGGTVREGSVDLSTSESKDTSSSTLGRRDTPKRAVCDSSDEDVNERLSQSPTPSEGGRAQVLSCSSSESSDALTEKLQLPASSSLSCSATTTIDEEEHEVVLRNQTSPKKGAQSLPQSPSRRFMGNKSLESDVIKGAVSTNPSLSLNTADLLQDVLITCHNQLKGKAATKPDSSATTRAQSPASSTWRRSTGWRRIQRGNGVHETHIPVPIGAKDRLKSPPPVPIRRTFAS
uniref:Autophagy-related protein 16 domain-containing protein n=1 Tax=Anopheles funestus TaxID=62324 RepID=A0A4Y0BL03_ANOFN